MIDALLLFLEFLFLVFLVRDVVLSEKNKAYKGMGTFAYKDSPAASVPDLKKKKAFRA